MFTWENKLSYSADIIKEKKTAIAQYLLWERRHCKIKQTFLFLGHWSFWGS